MTTRVFVAGHKGMVGSALCRLLARQADVELLTADRTTLDLLDQHAVQAWFAEHQPEQVYLAAAKVGGIHANNSFPAEFTGKLVWDSSKPDGTPRKLLDVSRLEALGWRASISLEEGLRSAYAWFVENAAGRIIEAGHDCR